VSQDNRAASERTKRGGFRAIAVFVFAVLFLAARGDLSGQRGASEPPLRIPTDVAWTGETLAMISRGDAFRGLLLAGVAVIAMARRDSARFQQFPTLQV
jgi:hypothetical protein